MTPTQIAALLSLDIKYRRRLWELGKAHGDWYGSDGIPLTVPVPTDYSWADDLLTIGHAFLPADQLVIMKAATPEGWEPMWNGHQWWYQEDITCECQHYAPTALECALKAWNQPEPTK